MTTHSQRSKIPVYNYHDCSKEIAIANYRVFIHNVECHTAVIKMNGLGIDVPGSLCIYFKNNIFHISKIMCCTIKYAYSIISFLLHWKPHRQGDRAYCYRHIHIKK